MQTWTVYLLQVRSVCHIIVMQTSLFFPWNMYYMYAKISQVLFSETLMLFPCFSLRYCSIMIIVLWFHKSFIYKTLIKLSIVVQRIVSVGLDPNNIMNVWDWKKGRILSTVKGHSARVSNTAIIILINFQFILMIKWLDTAVERWMKWLRNWLIDSFKFDFVENVDFWSLNSA